MSAGCPRLVWALYRPDLSPGARNVLVHMANVCDAALNCRDPMSKIGALFGMSVRSVMRCIRELELAGYLVIKRRFRQPNLYRVMVPESEDEKRANGPASYRNGKDISTDLSTDLSTQPFNGDKSRTTQPLDGDKMRQSVASGSDKSRTTQPLDGDKLAQEESPKEESPKEESPKEESPKESQQGVSFFGREGRQASKAAREGERDPTPAEIEARRRAYAETARALRTEAPTLAVELARMVGELDKVAYAPGYRVPDRDTQIERLNHKPAVTARPLSPEQLAIVRARSRGAACQQAYA